MPNNTGSFIFGLTFGALCGVVLAMLLTPQSGEETREYLGKKTEDLRKGAEDAVERARGGTVGIVERGRTMAEEAQTRLHETQGAQEPAAEPQAAQPHVEEPQTAAASAEPRLG